MSLIPPRGFDQDTLVRATATRRVVDAKGNPVKIKANTLGIADSSRLDDEGKQFVHFEAGSDIRCVNFPVEALAPA